MAHAEKIKTAFERNGKAVALRPSIGRRTVVSRARIRDGVACHIEEGPWKLTADLKKTSGGNETGPSPGVLGRAALGSCLAMGYVLWAAKLGVPLSSVEVEVQTDVDARGRYGIAAIPPGYLDVRYTVTVESTAEESDILKMIDQADAHSPLYDVFSRALKLRRKVLVVDKSC